MRALGGLCLVLVLCLTSRGQAQVSVDMRALDSGGPKHPPAQAVQRQPIATPAPAPKPAVQPTGASPGVAVTQKPVAAAHPQPRTASSARKTASVAKSETTQKPSPPVTATVMPQAGGTVPELPDSQPATPPATTMVPPAPPVPGPLPSPVRLVFEDGQTDLTPRNEAEIRDLARSIPAPAANSVSVLAYAAGKPDDPSTARRLSLSRGMAVRSVLLASGVPSAQIYVRALGAAAPGEPVDRVELVVAPIGTVTR